MWSVHLFPDTWGGIGIRKRFCSGCGAAAKGSRHSAELPELRRCWDAALRPGVCRAAARGCGLDLVVLMGPFQRGAFCDCVHRFTITSLFLVLCWHRGLLPVKVWLSEPSELVGTTQSTLQKANAYRQRLQHYCRCVEWALDVPGGYR